MSRICAAKTLMLQEPPANFQHSRKVELQNILRVFSFWMRWFEIAAPVQPDLPPVMGDGVPVRSFLLYMIC